MRPIPVVLEMGRTPGANPARTSPTLQSAAPPGVSGAIMIFSVYGFCAQELIQLRTDSSLELHWKSSLLVMQ
jgi:hypothetical protein